MARTVTRRVTVFVLSILLSISLVAQPYDDPEKNKPYRILTSGRQVTVKSTKYIRNIMVWTASGNRIVEQKDLNSYSYSFTPNVKEKYFFVMIQYDGMKPYTEKIGVK